MWIRRLTATCLLALLVLAAGCETTGGSNQLQATVYDTHKRIVKLDNSLEGSVTKLNETTAELIARVNDSDQETRRLRSMVEENQVKLDTIARELRELKASAYGQWGLTVPSGMAPMTSVEGEVGNIEIVPPVPPVTVPRTTPPAAAPAPAAAPPTPTPAPAAPAPAPPAAVVYGDPQVHYQQAQKSYSSSDYAKALQQFDEFLQRYPQSDLTANAQFWKAKCYLEQGQYQEAIQEFEKVRANYPTSSKVPFAMHNQAVAHSRLGQTDRAIRLMEEVVDQYPVSPAADQAKSDLQKLKGN